MNYKDLNLYNEDQPLILKNEVKTESEALQTNNLKQEISKIKNITIGINKNIQKDKSKITKELKNKTKELNLYKDEKNSLFEMASQHTLDKCVIQDKLINSQKKIISDNDEKIKFYQNENVRLSSELLNSQKLADIANENLSNIESKNNKIFNQIKDLQNYNDDNNIISARFKKSKQNFIEEDGEKNKNINLDVLVSDIFER
ncbi:hypothetical protein ABXT48_02390 [Candidatus Pelagibacter sp. Uisw_101]|uniref:hypothetical protein n=1 Tax=Candidatus Pelagibacter sp. Uisw_101 TaxID=3230982 RepID=UPI0039EA7E9F